MQAVVCNKKLWATSVIVGWLGITSGGVVVAQEAKPDVGNTPAQAGRMGTTARIRETLSSAADVDFFKLEIRKDRDNPAHDTSGNLTVNLSQKAPPGSNPKSGWQIDIFSQNDLGNSLYSLAWRETMLSAKFEIGLGVGIYYFKVSSIDSQVFPAVEYTIQNAWEETKYYEKESNNDSETATAITLNENYFGNLSLASDVDVYYFGLQTPDVVTIAFSQPFPGSDDQSGWQVGLLNDPPEKALKIPSTQQADSFQANLQPGTYYLLVSSFSPEASCADEEEAETTTTASPIEKKGPIGRRYQLLVKAASAPLPPQECPETVTYGQNPITLRWVSFPRPCDVPVGWPITEQIPDGFQECPACPVCPAVHHARYTLNEEGLLNIPLIDLFDAAGSKLGVYSAQLQGVPGPSPAEFKFLEATPVVEEVATPEVVPPTTP